MKEDMIRFHFIESCIQMDPEHPPVTNKDQHFSETRQTIRARNVDQASSFSVFPFRDFDEASSTLT